MSTSRINRRLRAAPRLNVALVALVALALGDPLGIGPMSSAFAQTSPASPPSAPAQTSPASPGAETGIAVVAIARTSDLAWPLAQEIYRRPSLRPVGLDEARARVLAGEAPSPGAPQSLRDLADTRDALRGDDAPTRQLLASIASALHVRALVVVTVEDADASVRSPLARVFLTDTRSFDAARYAPDDAPGSSVSVWSGAASSLERMYSAPSAPRADAAAKTAGSAALAPVPSASHDGKGDGQSSSHAFYSSPWFWGAVGAAVLGGAAVFLATRDNSPDTIHLQMQVPK